MNRTLTLALSSLAAAVVGSCSESSSTGRLLADVGLDPDTSDAAGLGDAPDILLADDTADPPADSGDDTSDEPDTVLPPKTPRCDGLIERHCVLPWPSSLYLEPDATRKTGHTLAFSDGSLPANQFGVHIAPPLWRRLDGYGTATSIVVYFEDLELDGFPREDDIGRSLDADCPSVLLEVKADGTTERVPHWVERDGRALTDKDRGLFLRPARILTPGARYVVAFRELERSDGMPVPRSALFQAFLDGDVSPDTDPRQARMDETFAVLEVAGISRESLTLAWDFNTASDDAIHGRMLEMRDKALAAVGPEGPELTVTEVRDFTPEENEYIAFEVKGTFRVPSFLKAEDTPLETIAWGFSVDASGALVQDDWTDEPFWVRVPRGALDGTPQGLFMHGHGQNGAGVQVRAGNIGEVCQDYDLIAYAANMAGMSETDIQNILGLIIDLSRSYWLTDRLHQGIINHVLLNLAMERRLGSLPALVDRGVKLDTTQHFYQGISQGGIYGPTVVAVSPFISRGHMGVPGANYSLLLSRSKNFDSFYTILDVSYESRLDQAVGILLIHSLWEHTDSVTWFRRLEKDPLPNTPPSQVLLAPAKGDHQVSAMTNEIVARSNVGVAVMANYDSEREVWGAPEVPYPHQGSALVLWDFGNPWPAPGSNLPPTISELAGDDPHGKPRSNDQHNAQMVHFWRTGEVIDVCGGDGCTPE